MSARIFLIPIAQIAFAAAAIAQPTNDNPAGVPIATNGLSLAETALLATLENRPLHALRGHVELAELLRLRSKNPKLQAAEPSKRIMDFAERSLDTPYKRGAPMFGLAEADCVTWTERVLVLALADSWSDAYALSKRLRYKDGSESGRNINHYPLADWLVNNAWLLEDVTEQLQVGTVPLDVYTNRAAIHVNYQSQTGRAFDPGEATAGLSGPELSLQTSYVQAADIAVALRRMRTGDIIFFIAQYPGKLGEPASPRCVHQAFLKKEGRQAWLLHCVQPRAQTDLLDRFVASRMPPGSFLGIKVVRVRQDAYALVAEELAARPTQESTPSQLDLRHGTAGADSDGTVFIRCTRAPDREVTIGRFRYGVVNIAQDETLSVLFKGQWKRVYELPINALFRRQFPNPDRIRPGERPIMFPVGLAEANGATNGAE